MLPKGFEKLEEKKRQLEKGISDLVLSFEKTTNTKVLSIGNIVENEEKDGEKQWKLGGVLDPKEIKVGLWIDVDKIKLS